MIEPGRNPSGSKSLDSLSPKAKEILLTFAKTTGLEDEAKVVEEMTYSVFALLRLVDTSRDPNIYPQDAVNVMTTVKSVLAKFTAFGEPTKIIKTTER
jgi:hypothetical protein